MKKQTIYTLILTILLAAGCTQKPKTHTEKSSSREIMGTFARTIAVAKDKKTAIKANKAAFDTLVAIDNMMSDYKPDSELSKLNKNAYKHPVKVSDELFEVISKSLQYSKLSNGAFDITIGPVVDLWKQADKNKQKPTKTQIEAAKSKVGYQKLIINREKQTIKFAVEGMRIDLGAIAKGYAIDRAAEKMRLIGAKSGMIDVGGDIICFGKPENRDKWAIGLQDPDEMDKLMMIIELGENAIATSGDYRRFYVLDGEEHSHIMKPQGVSVKGLTSVTVISDKAVDTDALATTVTVMGPEKGIEIIENMPDTEALIIPEDPEKDPVFSSGFEGYIRK